MASVEAFPTVEELAAEFGDAALSYAVERAKDAVVAGDESGQAAWMTILGALTDQS